MIYHVSDELNREFLEDAKRGVENLFEERSVNYVKNAYINVVKTNKELNYFLQCDADEMAKKDDQIKRLKDEIKRLKAVIENLTMQQSVETPTGIDKLIEAINNLKVTIKI